MLCFGCFPTFIIILSNCITKPNYIFSFLAGIDTTRLTLDWAMLYIASHPEIQSKMHKEIDQVLCEYLITYSGVETWPIVGH